MCVTGSPVQSSVRGQTPLSLMPPCDLCPAAEWPQRGPLYPLFSWHAQPGIIMLDTQVAQMLADWPARRYTGGLIVTTELIQHTKQDTVLHPYGQMYSHTVLHTHTHTELNSAPTYAHTNACMHTAKRCKHTHMNIRL